jgi:hypothetical protein
MQGLHRWMTEQFDKRLIEPNSGLGGALRYMLKHWTGLTLFLRQAGAPLDNNFRHPDLGGSPNGTSHERVDHFRAGLWMAEGLFR